MLTNAKDPLKETPDAERQLFNVLAAASRGFTNEQVVGAAVNLLVNVLRQSNATRRGAFEATDRAHAAMRQVLDAHYDASGRRRNIFPFHQVIEVPFSDFRKGK
jgi:hypothetical protein